ncbi:MAG: tRNA (adenosine(37)-N6)-dimethylallyltransferase MiaA [Persephonella sp.]|nr:MAG: tRNA (adenosine(37)-N6)-dimethylallyltransferase MiaA [Persephonella sp.]RUM61249.1 MAG: tRNA (adenosine(37)-N6)-dimethylallyltransferase MiaA [Persephonella sp.]
MDKIVVITGATATGKTDLAIKLAEMINGEIISADSMMVYKYMDIGTAKPPKDIRKKISHYIIDVVKPSEIFSVKDFVELADRHIKDIKARGKTPIIVGGTWLYIQALLYGLSDAPKGDWALRKKLYERDTEELYEELKKVDLEYSKKINRNDKRRIVRALEVFYLSGKPFSYFQNKHGFKEERYSFIGFVLERNREDLMKAIENRVDKMFSEGLVDEVKFLIDMGYKNFLTSSQAIGYKELIPFFDGYISLNEAKENIIKNTKKFAKKQIKTFRSKFGKKNNWNFVNINDKNFIEIFEKII